MGAPNTGTTASANALAIETGGGLDIRLANHLAFRALQINYLRSLFPNSITNVRNSLDLGSGFVLRFK